VGGAFSRRTAGQNRPTKKQESGMVTRQFIDDLVETARLRCSKDPGESCLRVEV